MRARNKHLWVNGWFVMNSHRTRRDSLEERKAQRTQFGMPLNVFYSLFMASHRQTQIDSLSTQNLSEPDTLPPPCSTSSQPPWPRQEQRIVWCLFLRSLLARNVCMILFFFLFLSASLPIAETLITPSRCSRFHSNDKAFFLRLVTSQTQRS